MKPHRGDRTVCGKKLFCTFGKINVDLHLNVLKMLCSITNLMKQSRKRGPSIVLSNHGVTGSYSQCRFFMMKLLDSVLNIYDKERIKEFGADRVCAEWILKTGGRIRWVGTDSWVEEYNGLPSDAVPADLKVFRLQDVDASGATIMGTGFGHFRNLKDIKSVKLHSNKYLNDGCLRILTETSDTLEQLQISANKNITDKGLLHFSVFKNLTDLHLKDLPGVKDPKGVYEKLHEALPNCDIIYMESS